MKWNFLANLSFIFLLFRTAKVISLRSAQLEPLFLIRNVHFSWHAFQTWRFGWSALVRSSSWKKAARSFVEVTNLCVFFIVFKNKKIFLEKKARYFSSTYYDAITESLAHSDSFSRMSQKKPTNAFATTQNFVLQQVTSDVLRNDRAVVDPCRYVCEIRQ